MNTDQTVWRRRSSVLALLPAAAVTLAVLGAAGCTSAQPEVAAPTPSAPSSTTASAPTAAPSAVSPTAAPSTTPAAPSEAADVLTIDITIAGGKVTPNGRKVDAEVGQKVVLNVTSDEDDEIHAHVDGDGYELEVAAGRKATGSFTLTSPGSFEVESHHLEKIIVILNAR